MKIQIINFDVNPEHYQITHMIRRTLHHELDYVPFHQYQKTEHQGVILLAFNTPLSLQSWCQKRKIPFNKIIVVSRNVHPDMISWFWKSEDPDIPDFEKLMGFLSSALETLSDFTLFQSLTLTYGKTSKNQEFEACLEDARKHSPTRTAECWFYIKERVLPQNWPLKPVLHFHFVFLKSLDDHYEYLWIEKRV